MITKTLRHIFNLSTLLLCTSSRSHVGDPFYVFTKHLADASTHPESICHVNEFNPDKRQKYAVLKKMLLENGAEINKADIYEFGHDNFAMKATSEIKKDERIAFIPLELILTHEKAQSAQVIQALKSKNFEHDFIDFYSFTLFIMEERRNPDSFWKPYIDIFPTKCSNYPQFWSQEELKWLVGTNLLPEIQKRNNDLMLAYVKIA